MSSFILILVYVQLVEAIFGLEMENVKSWRRFSSLLCSLTTEGLFVPDKHGEGDARRAVIFIDRFIPRYFSIFSLEYVNAKASSLVFPVSR